MTVSTLLFDLGGVLFELSGAGRICRWTRERLTPEQLLERWLSSAAVRAFETGQIDYLVFRSRLKAELGLMASDSEFTDAFAAWVKGTYPGTEDLLGRLSGRYRLACFSNTNPFHWEILKRDYQVLPLFDHIFASFQMGRIKPDRAAYFHVLKALGRPPESILFFDDSQANVDAARACGIKACCVSGIDGVKKALEEYGLRLN